MSFAVLEADPLSPALQVRHRHFAAAEQLPNAAFTTRFDGLGRGEEVYRSTCAVCHDPKGRGYGPYRRRLIIPPTDLTSAAVQAKTEEEISRLISLGRSHTTIKLSSEDRHAVAAYIKSALEPAE